MLVLVGGWSDIWNYRNFWFYDARCITAWWINELSSSISIILHKCEPVKELNQDKGLRCVVEQPSVSEEDEVGGTVSVY